MAKRPAQKLSSDATAAPPPFRDNWPGGWSDWPLAKIKPYPNNPVVHPEDQIALLVSIFKKYGPDQPIVVDEDCVIIKGHGRLMAAKRAGFEVYPVVQRFGLSEEDKKTLRISDNQSQRMSSWDMKLLKIEVGPLHLSIEHRPLLGFSTSGFAGILNTTKGRVDPDAIPKLSAKPGVRTGDLWTLGRHQLLCGDSTKAEDYAKVCGGTIPVLMDTDPPYGVNYDPEWRNATNFKANRAVGKVSNDGRADWTPAWQLFKGDVAYVWHGGLHGGEVERSLEAAGFKLRAQIIWNKQNQVFSRGDYHWKHEPCFYVVREGRPGRWAGDRKQTTVWDIANHNPMGGNRDEEQTGHSTQKPVECMARPMRNSSKPGDAVYDPFCGSGSTIIAAEMEGRRALAIEIDPVYVQAALERWMKFTGLIATLDGVPFDKVMAARRKGRPIKGGDNATRDSGKPVRRKKPVPAAGGVAAVAK